MTAAASKQSLRRFTSIQNSTVLPFMEPLHIIGSGSMGLLFGASIRIAFPSYPVCMLVRPHHTPRLSQLPGKNRHALQVCLQSIGGNDTNDKKQNRPRLVQLPAQIISTQQHWRIRNLIVATKAPDAAAAVQSILPRLKRRPEEETNENHATTVRVIILSNGALAVREEIVDLLRGQQQNDFSHVQILLASTTHGAYRDNDDGDDSDTGDSNEDYLYHVVHAGRGKTYVQDQPALARLLDQAGLNASSLTEEEIEVQLWHKLAANCVINPLTALHQCTNGDLLSQGLYQEFAPKLLKEVAQVTSCAVQSGRPSEKDSDSLLSSLDTFVQQVIHDTASNKSSMLQDVQRQQPTEIDYLNGYICKKGQEYDIETPENADMCRLIHQLSTAKQGPII